MLYLCEFASVWFRELNSMVNLKFWYGIGLNWCWIWARVHESSCEFSGFWSVTERREKLNLFVLMWRVMNLILTRKSLYRLPCGLWPIGDCHVDLDLLAWLFGLNWLIFDLEDQSANMKKNGTVLQFKIWTVLKVKKEKWTDLQLKKWRKKRKKRFGTNLQLNTKFGPNCKQ